MKSVYVAAGVAALLSAGNAAAQTGTASFNIGSVAVDLTIPAGFCAPTGSAVHKAAVGVASDKENTTHLTLYACAQMENATISDYFLIKTPSTLLNTPATREEVLTALTAEMSDPSFSAENLSSDAGDKATKSISEASGTATKITTDIRPLGRDKDCAYMGGIVNASTEAGVFSLNVGGCITAVGNRLVMVFRYTKGTTTAAAAKLLPDARKLAMALRAK